MAEHRRFMRGSVRSVMLLSPSLPGSVERNARAGAEMRERESLPTRRSILMCLVLCIVAISR